MKSVVHRTDDEIPDRLRHHDVAKAFYGLTQELLQDVKAQQEGCKEFAEELGLSAERIIREIRIVNWSANEDIINQMKLAIEDFALDSLGERYGIRLDFDDLDLLVEKMINVAKVRMV